MPTFENERKNWYSKFRNLNCHQPNDDGYTGGAQGVRKEEFKDNLSDGDANKSSKPSKDYKLQ